MLYILEDGTNPESKYKDLLLLFDWEARDMAPASEENKLAQSI